MVILSGGKRSKYSFGTYHGVWGFTMPHARKKGFACDCARNSAALPAICQSDICSRLSGKAPQSCLPPRPLSGIFSFGGLASSDRPLLFFSMVSSHTRFLTIEPSDEPKTFPPPAVL